MSALQVPSIVGDLLRLQRAAYAVEAALLGDDRIPALHEDENDLVAAGLDWLVELEGDEIVGALGYLMEDDTMDLDRLIVDPAHHRRGIGTRLVQRAQATASRIVVSTGRDNHPARALYARLGFVRGGDREVLPGLWISTYVLDGPGRPPLDCTTTV